MERKIYLQAVAEACLVKDVANLNSMPQKELVNKIILPRLVGVPRDDVRYNRITGRFMQFMADYGQTCVELDRDSGDILMELAMQRLSRGAVIHTGIHLVNILPDEYKQYTAAYDEPGLMGPECWNFIKSNLVFCAEKLSKASYCAHASEILLGLVRHLNPDGSTNHGYMWNDADYVGATGAEAYEWAEENACEVLGIRIVSRFLMQEWRLHKAFFARHQDELNWDELFHLIDLEGENYFNPIQRGFYKMFGLYEKRTKERIRQELTCHA